MYLTKKRDLLRHIDNLDNKVKYHIVGTHPTDRDGLHTPHRKRKSILTILIIEKLKGHFKSGDTACRVSTKKSLKRPNEYLGNIVVTNFAKLNKGIDRIWS